MKINLIKILIICLLLHKIINASVLKEDLINEELYEALLFLNAKLEQEKSKIELAQELLKTNSRNINVIFRDIYWPIYIGESYNLLGKRKFRLAVVDKLFWKEYKRVKSTWVKNCLENFDLGLTDLRELQSLLNPFINKESHIEGLEAYQKITKLYLLLERLIDEDKKLKDKLKILIRNKVLRYFAGNYLGKAFRKIKNALSETFLDFILMHELKDGSLQTCDVAFASFKVNLLQDQKKRKNDIESNTASEKGAFELIQIKYKIRVKQSRTVYSAGDKLEKALLAEVIEELCQDDEAEKPDIKVEEAKELEVIEKVIKEVKEEEGNLVNEEVPGPDSDSSQVYLTKLFGGRKSLPTIELLNFIARHQGEVEGSRRGAHRKVKNKNGKTIGVVVIPHRGTQKVYPKAAMNILQGLLDF